MTASAVITYKKRRKAYRENLLSNDISCSSCVILVIGGLEEERHRFRQHSSFYYLTGINEPGAVVALYPDGSEVLYLPRFNEKRAAWVQVTIDSATDPAILGFDAVKYLGSEVKGYGYDRMPNPSYYSCLVDDLCALGQSVTIFTAVKPDIYYQNQLVVLEQIKKIVPIEIVIHNSAGVLNELRRIKDHNELSLINHAIGITIKAQQQAAAVLVHGAMEYHVLADIERVFLHNNAQHNAFPSIVAAGKNATILHYTERNDRLHEGDLVVIDIGAEYEGYAADLTRTYPVGGRFSQRQREIYQAVLDTQGYIADLAKPGMFLRNEHEREKSLHHRAVEYLADRGFADYFPHGIGHYMGLDVHDVGDYTKPLEPGVVFTIEPGIYIKKEGLGVRIEDDYLMGEQGVICLSKSLPKNIEDIETFMQ